MHTLPLQSCRILCDLMDSSPPGSPVPGTLQARTLEWVAISFYNAWKWKVKVKLLSRVWLFVTPWTAAFQAPPSMGFSRQEYWRCVCVHTKSLQLCLTLCNPMDCSPSGSSIHGILQARILEWVAMHSSRGSCQPRDHTHVSYIPCIGRRVLYHWHHLGSPYTVVENSKYRQTSSFQLRQVLEIIKDGVRRQYDTGRPLEWIIRESSPAVVTLNWSLKD